MDIARRVSKECPASGGTLQLQRYWQTKKCSWAVDKATFVVSRSLRGHSILDKSDGVPENATVRAEQRSTGCAIEIVQTIDPEGVVAGSKSVSIAKYAYYGNERAHHRRWHMPDFRVRRRACLYS